VAQLLNAVRTGGKAGLFRHGQPTAHLVGSLKKFVAFLCRQ
jgi:antitoxin (DNA-binding transcriptional repressor) of toxin-antitoxin stability system